MVLINLGSNAYQRSQWSTALEMSARGSELLKKTGNVAEAAYGSFNMAEVLVDQGHLDEASAIVAELRDLWVAVGHVLGLAYLDGLRGRLAARRGDHLSAIEALTEAEASLRRNGLGAFAIEMAGRCAESMVALGDVAAAFAKVDAAVKSEASLGATQSMPLLLRVRAICRFAAGDVAGATADLADSLALARERDATHDIVLGLHVSAAIDPANAHSLRAELDVLAATLGMVELPVVPLTTGEDSPLLV
jgi:tetratricopeptide (TPR) repeat protein